MEIRYDKEGLTGKYDERNLDICKCGKHRYPSKKMFVEFLKQFEDIKGTVDIWSEQDIPTGKVKIHVELEYQIKKKK